jgi:hypothetical protein
MIIALEHQDETESEFKTRMVAFIKERFAGLLGPHIALLDEPGGLDQLSEMLRAGIIPVQEQRVLNRAA